MKDMYYLNTFLQPKNEGVNEWAGAGRIWKTTQT